MKKEKPFQVLYCIKGNQKWVLWKFKRDQRCPCCGETAGIIWDAPKKRRVTPCQQSAK